MAQNKNRAKINIPLHLIVLLLCLTMLSVHLTNGMFARYLATADGHDSARVIKFGNLTLTETGDFADGEDIFTPGVNLKKKAVLSFEGSEAATYVFVEVEAPQWDTADNRTFTIHTDRLQFSIDAAWTHLPTVDDHYIYYLILNPNTTLAADIIANDGNIQVSAQITKDEIAAMTDIAIVLRAAVVQIGEFASPAAAWASLASKGG